MRPSHPQRLSGALLLLGVAALASSCGANSNGATTSITVGPPRTASAHARSAPAATSASHTTSVQGTINDAAGDRAELTLSIGQPEPLAAVTEPMAMACNQEIQQDGGSLTTAVAVPIHTTVELTSSVKVPLGLNLGEVASLNSERHEVEPLTNPDELWATTYGSGEPECPTNRGGAATIWPAESIQPGRAQSWLTWLIVTGAITPNDPSGSGVVDQLLLRPRAGLGTDDIEGDVKPAGTGWVRCPVDESIVGPHLESYVALNRAAASRGGCTTMAS